MRRGLHPYVHEVYHFLPKVRRHFPGWDYRVTSGFRSMSKQARLYADWRAGRRTLPAAPPGRSRHNFGRALDMITNDRALLNEVMAWLGFRWAGPRDPVHYDV